MSSWQAVSVRWGQGRASTCRHPWEECRTLSKKTLPCLQRHDQEAKGQLCHRSKECREEDLILTFRAKASSLWFTLRHVWVRAAQQVHRVRHRASWEKREGRNSGLHRKRQREGSREHSKAGVQRLLPNQGAQPPQKVQLKAFTRSFTRPRTWEEGANERQNRREFKLCHRPRHVKKYLHAQQALFQGRRSEEGAGVRPTGRKSGQARPQGTSRRERELQREVCRSYKKWWESR